MMFTSKWSLLWDYCLYGLGLFLKKQKCIKVLAVPVPCVYASTAPNLKVLLALNKSILSFVPQKRNVLCMIDS